MIKYHVGDRVFSYSLQEWGEVKSTNNKYNIPMYVLFGKYDMCYFTLDGRRSESDKARDLFFDEVTIELPKRPLQDKDIVKCWDEYAQFEVTYRFYNSINKSTWNSNGTRSCHRWNNMVYVPDEKAPEELVAMRDKLEN